MSTRNGSRSGFTIVEVLIAIVILAVGMLALATTSIFATTQVRVADLKTEESIAVQQVVEQLRSVPYDDVVTRSENSAQQVGSFQVWWTVTPQNRFLSSVVVYTKGPGYINNVGWNPAVRDTFVVEIANSAVAGP